MTDKDIDLATHHDVTTEPRCYKALAEQEFEHAVHDALIAGAGITIGGKRIDPSTIYKQEPVAWGIIASNTGRMCQVELDYEEVSEHNPKHIVPLYTAPQSNDIAELEHENRLLRARNERLQALVDSIVPHLESWCGANAMPPKRMAEHITDWSAAWTMNANY